MRSLGALNKAAEVYAKENRQALQYPGLQVQVDDARNLLLERINNTTLSLPMQCFPQTPVVGAHSPSSFTPRWMDTFILLAFFYSDVVTQHGNRGLFGHLANFSERVSHSDTTRVGATCCCWHG